MDRYGEGEDVWLRIDPQALRAGARAASELAMVHESCIRCVGGAAAISSESWSSPGGARFQGLLMRIIDSLRRRADHHQRAATVLDAHASGLEEAQREHHSIQRRLESVSARVEALEATVADPAGTAFRSEIDWLKDEAAAWTARLARILEEGRAEAHRAEAELEDLLLTFRRLEPWLASGERLLNPDYATTEVSAGWDGVSGGVGMTRSRSGALYLSVEFGGSLPGLSASVREGWVNTRKPASDAQVDRFIEGPSFTVAGYAPLLALTGPSVAETWGNEGRPGSENFATEVGVGCGEGHNVGAAQGFAWRTDETGEVIMRQAPALGRRLADAAISESESEVQGVWRKAGSGQRRR